MRTATNTEQNQAAGLVPWRVCKVDALPSFRLFVQFVDGTEGIVDMAAFLEKECGVFKALRDVEAFEAVRIENGAVTWPNELDLAPDNMHEKLQNAEVYAMR